MDLHCQKIVKKANTRLFYCQKIVKKANTRLFFLKQLKRAKLQPEEIVGTNSDVGA